MVVLQHWQMVVMRTIIFSLANASCAVGIHRTRAGGIRLGYSARPSNTPAHSRSTRARASKFRIAINQDEGRIHHTFSASILWRVNWVRFVKTGNIVHDLFRGRFAGALRASSTVEAAG